MKNIFKRFHIGTNHDPNRSSNEVPSSSSSPLPSPSCGSDHRSASTAAAAVISPPSPSLSPSSAAPPASAVLSKDYFSSEEEYQIQLAMAISASNSEFKDDPDIDQIRAATLLSLGTHRSILAGEDVGDAEALSRRYWDYNVVDYDENVLDGFYDIYGLSINSASHGKMPSLVELQTSIGDLGFEVIIVNRTIDPALVELEQVAHCISLDFKEADFGFLVQRISELVAQHMGGPVRDAHDILARWMERSTELRASQQTSLLPIGYINIGLSRHRSLLFKVLADNVGIPCRLVKGSHYTGIDDDAVNIIKLGDGREFLVDLMAAPGTLIPADVLNTKDVTANSYNGTMNHNLLPWAANNSNNDLFKSEPSYGERNGGTETSTLDDNSVSDHNSKYEKALSIPNVPSPPRREPSTKIGSSFNTINLYLPDQFNQLSSTITVTSSKQKEIPELVSSENSQDTVDSRNLFSELNPFQAIGVGKSSAQFKATDNKNIEYQRRRENIAAGTSRLPPLVWKNRAPCNVNPNTKLNNNVEGLPQRKNTGIEGLNYASSSNSSRPASREYSEGQNVRFAAISGLPERPDPSGVGTSDNGKSDSSSRSSSCPSGGSNSSDASGRNNDGEGDGKYINAQPNKQLILSQSSRDSYVEKTHRNGLALQSRMMHELEEHTEDINGKHDRKKYAHDRFMGTNMLSGVPASSSQPRSSRIDPMFDDVAELEIPWEHLVIGERIGLGSYGEVYHADWNGTEVAVTKFLDQDFYGDALDEFRSEVRIMRRLRHPNAVLFMGAVTRPPNLSVVSEFLPRFLPPEIVYLKKLVELDLSFNKLKNLPNYIGELNALKSLRVANNKLVDMPSGISSLRKLENLDLSNNRLISLTPLKLDSMCTLRYLNIQYNKLHYYCQIPSWICCNFGGNEEDMYKPEKGGSMVEANIGLAVQKAHVNRSSNGPHITSQCFHPEALTSCRCSLIQRMKKGWKRRDCLQQRARQERLNNSRKCRVNDYCDSMIMKMGEQSDSCKSIMLEDIECELQFDINEEEVMDRCTVDDVSYSINGDESDVGRGICLTSLDCGDNEKSRLNDISYGDDSSCLTESTNSNKEYDNENESVSSNPAVCPRNELSRGDSNKSSSDTVKFIVKSKRHCDRDLDNPKPSKFRKPVGEGSSLSCKYSTESFCSIDDHLPDGFYDAGRNCPFISLEEHEQSLCLDSREVILLDRNRDEELDAIASSAQILLSRFSRPFSGGNKDYVVDNLQRASILALFVSDCFGGSERSSAVIKLRKAVVGSNKQQQPFICTCSAVNANDNGEMDKQAFAMVENLNFNVLCENSLRLIKAARGSNVVPIGTLQFGVCRHRAVLMKYLCDRADPPIPCELVRGYLDFMPHAWNAILVQRGNLWVRMVVDACYPTDIREETDIEYYCRYIPLSRLDVPLTTESSPLFGSSFSSPMMCHGTEKRQSRTVFHCKYGTLNAAVKVRSLESCKASQEEVRNFEYTFLGEVRMLNALRKHSCIVEIYGHQLSSKWVPSVDRNNENRLLQSIIVMECVKGGSLKIYLDKLLENGEKHVPINIALCIARDVACALAELHSKYIIHRDIKSENVLIDMDCKRSDGTPVVKLADFDRSVPLHSFMHTCCNAHLGIHPSDVCVGTPRWMAPEVVQAMHQRNPYGLEVDIWSYGCLLYELLTLRIPYFGHSEAEIYNLLQMKRRPRLTPELEALALFDKAVAVSEPTPFPSDANVTADTMYLLVELFYQCTSSEPSDRPTSHYIYEKLDEAARQLYSAQTETESSSGSSSTCSSS